MRTDTEDAAIASNCVLNTGAFRDDEEVHSYVSRIIVTIVIIIIIIIIITYCLHVAGFLPSCFLFGRVRIAPVHRCSVSPFVRVKVV